MLIFSSVFFNKVETVTRTSTYSCGNRLLEHESLSWLAVKAPSDPVHSLNCYVFLELK